MKWVTGVIGGYRSTGVEMNIESDPTVATECDDLDEALAWIERIERITFAVTLVWEPLILWLIWSGKVVSLSQRFFLK